MSFPRRIIIPVLILVCACNPGAAPVQGTKTYANPIIEADGPDPSVLKADDGFYYLYTTAGDISIYRSKDLVDWTKAGTAFNNGSRPSESRYGYGRPEVWAPDVHKINGQYVMFFSLWWGDDGTYDGHAVAYAVSNSPAGPFDFRGILVSSDPDYPPYYGTGHSIDPCYVSWRGRNYLFWGSFRGIYCARLSISKNLDIGIDTRTLRQIAGNEFEGTAVFHRKGWWYLFASKGDWSGGENSTYRTTVGRSRHITGPYTDRNGRDMLDNGAECILAGNDIFCGTGHNSGLVEDMRGRTWMFYHAYKIGETYKGRMTMLDEVKWDKAGWPYIESGAASSISECPDIH